MGAGRLGEGGRDQTWAVVVTVGLGGGGRDLTWAVVVTVGLGEGRVRLKVGVSWLPWGWKGVGKTKDGLS